MTTSAYTYGSKTQTRPERFAHWLFYTCGSWRNILAFGLVAALTYISVRFNVELGKLNAVDKTSKELLPTGYALLDLVGLFLSGYIGIRTKSPIRKMIAWAWFFFLLSLSLWAAASFTLSVDYRLENAELTHEIEAKKSAIETQAEKVEIWKQNLSDTTLYKTRYGNILTNEQDKHALLVSELGKLESRTTPPALAIYERIAPYLEVSTGSLITLVKLAWAAALTLSPIILMLLVAAEFGLIQSEEATTNHTPTTTPPSGNKAKRKFLDDLQNRFKSPYSRKSHTSPLPATAELSESKQAPNLTQTSKPELTQMGKAMNDDLTQLGKADPQESVPSEAKESKPKPKRSKAKPRPRNYDSADTGTKAGKGNRYAEIKKQVSLGKVRPSKPGIKKAAQCNQITAEKYLSSMAEEGIITRLENGQYRLIEDVVKLRAVQ